MTRGMKLHQMNLYDLLLKINDHIQKKDVECIIDIIDKDGKHKCPNNMNCEECLNQYLNEHI